ncbi:hypothetical protein [Kitasatospora phosalacinea]|uniref:Uncharacterized protein n=1 Tax=Kitasatospora phosalacinea TaxID=2065 RepID=A0A9W6USG1_9ACTN|nr:hypothetical protein [Kitasatospora phosalacinea]GLW58558.1 hypothetical protein Kpho01_65690 [Kitasatospora phosalacinea]
MNPRYIAYFTDPSGGGNPEPVTSVRQAADRLRTRARDPRIGCTEQSVVDLYLITDGQMLVDAEEMAGVGVPFDGGPDFRITLGPRGGARIER